MGPAPNARLRQLPRHPTAQGQHPTARDTLRDRIGDGSKYKFGDAALWSLHGQYRVVPTVAVDLGVDGRYARMDKATDAGGTVANVENTGGIVLSAAPGIYVNPGSDVWLFVRAQIPFFEGLDGQQDVKPSVSTGLQYQAL